MERYQTTIRDNKDTIIREYNNCLAYFEELSGQTFGRINPDKKILLGLYICDYKAHHRKHKNELISTIKEDAAYKNHPYPIQDIGTFEHIEDSTLEKKMFNKFEEYGI